MRARAIEVRRGAVHCMANTTDRPCIVRERQTGLCREHDIQRHLDAYGRTSCGADTDAVDTYASESAKRLYAQLLQQLQDTSS